MVEAERIILAVLVGGGGGGWWVVVVVEDSELEGQTAKKLGTTTRPTSSRLGNYQDERLLEVHRLFTLSAIQKVLAMHRALALRAVVACHTRHRA